eukprot:6384227-Pyramimonas_sp.AAC.1
MRSGTAIFTKFGALHSLSSSSQGLGRLRRSLGRPCGPSLSTSDTHARTHARTHTHTPHSSWPHREIRRRPQSVRSHGGTSPISTPPSRASRPTMDFHRRPQWLRSHGGAVPI